jgi:hypothetical protein
MRIEVRDIFNENIINIEYPYKEMDYKINNSIIQVSNDCGYEVKIMEDESIIINQIWDEAIVKEGRIRLLNLLNYINSLLF